MRIKEILRENEYRCGRDVGDITFQNICYTPDKADEESLFVLIRGVRYDTDQLLGAVRARHPRAIITETTEDDPGEEVPCLRVENARAVLSLLWYRWCRLDEAPLTYIGITGTNGKTSTSEMLVAALRAGGHRVGRIGTGIIEAEGEILSDRFYSMTTPDPDTLYPAIRKMWESGCDTVVMEVSSHALALEKVAPLHFRYAVFTNLSEEHLDFHKDMQDYFLAKLQLFQQADVGIVNADDPYADRLIRGCSCKIIRTGCLWPAEIRARNVQDKGLSGVRYLYKAEELSFIVRLRFPGIYNVYNSLLALTVAIADGVRPCVAKEALNNLPGIRGRMETVSESPRIIIDYAHTESALENALKTVNKSKEKGQNIITVFGCGGDREREKRPRMAAVAEKYSDTVIVTSDNNRTEDGDAILRDIVAGFVKSNHRVVPDREEAILCAIAQASDSDIVLVAGKGRESYNIDNTGAHPFDEEEIIRRGLAHRENGV